MAVATERGIVPFVGESRNRGRRRARELTEPATGEHLARVAMAGTEDVDRAVEAARAAARRAMGEDSADRALSTAPCARRRDAPEPQELAELEVRNVGKAISSVKAELAQGVENFRFYASAVASIGGCSNPVGGSPFLFAERARRRSCRSFPNYPLMMSTWKLAPALAAAAPWY